MLHDNGVKVIRIGLHASENLSDPKKCYAGASHSALGELVLGEFYYEKIRRALKEADIRSGRAVLKVPVGATSRAIGQNKRNKLRLMSEFELKDLRITEDKDLSSGEVLIGLQEGGK